MGTRKERLGIAKPSKPAVSGHTSRATKRARMQHINRTKKQLVSQSLKFGPKWHFILF